VKEGVIATLFGVPRYDTLMIIGIIQGQCIIFLIDGGATHSFIGISLVARRALQIEEFEGFDVAVANGHMVECLDRVPNLEVHLSNYIVKDTFYVVNLSDIDVVLGVQCLITLGNIYTNYQKLEMGFRETKGKKIVLRGMSTRGPRTVSKKRIERIFRHGGVAYAVECVITMQRDSDNCQQYQEEIMDFFSQCEQFFSMMSPGRPPDRGFEHTIEMEILAYLKSHL
jgi:hypothetical protein